MSMSVLFHCSCSLLLLYPPPFFSFFFFFNDTATTEIYTLSLHDALPICAAAAAENVAPQPGDGPGVRHEFLDGLLVHQDRKSTRLNSSHLVISYAVFCLKKKKKNKDVIQYLGCAYQKVG